MPKIFYKEYKPNAASAQIIMMADSICTEYAAQGFTLTLRQLYYQFVARGYIANKQAEYDRLGGLVNQARLAGMIDWDMIEDRTRNLEKLASWSSPQDILDVCAKQFKHDLWDSQPIRCAVWIEKEALAGVIEPICNKYRVPFFACRGYVSQSESWRAGQRFGEYIQRGQEVQVFHLGDHDPSGIDMTRDNRDRIVNFVESDIGPDTDQVISEVIKLDRLALNMDQVRQYSPPPNPAKFTDSRATGYVAKYGDKSWELDALEPKVISDLIERNILGLIDADRWEAAVKKETANRDRLKELADNWEDEQ